MNIGKLGAQAFGATIAGAVVEHALHNLSNQHIKLTCLAYDILIGKDRCEAPTFLVAHCCSDDYPASPLDNLVLGGVLCFAISVFVKQTFLQPKPNLDDNARAQNLVTGLPETPTYAAVAATKEADTAKHDPVKELETDSVEALLASNTKQDAGALVAYTATKASDKRADFDTAAASQVTSYGGSSNNVLALDTFSKQDSIVGSALAQQIMSGKQLFATEEDFETTKKDGTVVVGRKQVVKTETGTAFRTMTTTTDNNSSTKSKSTVLFSNEYRGAEADALLQLLGTPEKKNK